MDQELISYLDKRFGEIDQRFDTITKELKQTRILVEGLRVDVQRIAEALATFWPDH